jgi:biopolymer transport protein ExbD
MRIFESSRSGYTPKIRIINLVDILLILLLFLFVTTTFRAPEQVAVQVALPEAKTAEAVGKGKAPRLVVTVTPDQKIFLDKDQIGLVALEQAMRDAKGKDREVMVELSADRNVSYGTVVAIVDAARAAGVHNITAFTKKTVAADKLAVP